MQTNLERKISDIRINYKKLLSNLPILLLIIIAALIALQTFFLIHDKDFAESSVKTHAKQEIDRVTKELDLKFQKLMSITQSFSADMSQGKISNATLLDSLKNVMDINTQIYAFGVAFEPYAYQPQTEKFARYYVRQKGNLALIKLDEIENYLEVTPEGNWYHYEMDNGPVWVEPYYMPEVDVSIVEFGLPFYRIEAGKKVKAGLVYIDYSISDIKDIMTSLDLGKTGYGYIISKKGKYVAHPIDEYVKGEKSIYDAAKALGNKDLEQLGKNITGHESGLTEFNNELNGQASWLIYKTIPSTSWSLVINFIKALSNSDIIKKRHQVIRLTLGISLFLIILCLFLFGRYRTVKRNRWLAVFCCSVVLVLCLGSIWRIALTYAPYPDEKQDAVMDKAGLNTFTDSQLKLAESNHNVTPKFVPTGVFVDSMEILNANDVRINGYIWQKYSSNLSTDIKRSFIMPEMISGSFNEIYRETKDNIETIRWSFNVVVRQSFDYTRYPLQSNGIYLKIMHSDFDKNVVLIPDLDSYSITNPTSLPGVQPVRSLPGWNVSSSYFTYMSNNYGTNMGVDSRLGHGNLPQLTFTMIVNKEFIAPFITDLLPIFVIFCALFAVLLMLTKEEKSSQIFGMKTSGVISTSSGLLFSVIISHTRLRNELPVKEIIYLENFYLLLYILIILVAVNAFVFSTTNNIRIIQYRDNIVPKLFYWPTVLTILVVITLRIFY
jgi:hypothetical protein